MKKLASFLSIVFICLSSSCTLSFQNIHTSGTASDIVDEEQETSPNISPDISIPFVPGV